VSERNCRNAVAHIPSLRTRFSGAWGRFWYFEKRASAAVEWTSAIFPGDTNGLFSAEVWQGAVWGRETPKGASMYVMRTTWPSEEISAWPIHLVPIGTNDSINRSSTCFLRVEFCKSSQRGTIGRHRESRSIDHGCTNKRALRVQQHVPPKGSRPQKRSSQIARPPSVYLRRVFQSFVSKMHPMPTVWWAPTTATIAVFETPSSFRRLFAITCSANARRTPVKKMSTRLNQQPLIVRYR